MMETADKKSAVFFILRVFLAANSHSTVPMYADENEFTSSASE
jgi:hypothetical protein